MKKINIKKLLSTIILSLLFLPIVVFALENNYSFLGNSLPENPKLPEFAAYFINIGISISAILAVLVIIFGGLQYLIFGAMGKQNSEGKEWVKSGGLGLFLLTTAYIILATINPALVNPKMAELLNVIPFVNIPISSLNKGVPIEYYKEIPIGTLTETLLSRKFDCYDFDEFGDPVQVEIKTDSGKIVQGPTYLQKDRVDCVLKLNKAIESKSKVIKELSIKIANLMKPCSCQQQEILEEEESENPANNSYQENQSTSSNIINCMSTGSCPTLFGVELDKCEEQSCGLPLPCSCSDNCEPNPNEFSLCPQGVKGLIKGINGSIPIEFGGSTWEEFNEALLKGMMPPPTGYISYISSLWHCMFVNSSVGINPKQYRGLKEFDDDGLSPQTIISLVEKDKVKIDNKDVILINNQNWHNLRLIQQLTYLKEKLFQLTSTIKKDSDELSSAVDELNRCYLPTTYVDYLKKSEQTRKDGLVLMTQKNYNQYENKFTDISKYCSGFGYLNSDCFYNCENSCPSSSPQVINLFKDCFKDCDKLCDDKSASCLSSKNNCKNIQKICVADIYLNKKPCNASESGDFNNFQECINVCRNDCQDVCLDKYKNCNDVIESCRICVGNMNPLVVYPNTCEKLSENFCSEDFEKCVFNCKNDSKCLLDNKEECIYNSESIITCSNKNTDQENLENCIDNSYKCKYGSSQYAGYPDCLKEPFSLKDEYSSSKIFENQDWQKCPNPNVANPKSNCYSKEYPSSTCKEICPEVEKCPSNSLCPTCPCETISFIKKEYNTNYQTGGVSKNEVVYYQVVGGQCEEYKYNDDPLTFYCNEKWWDSPELKDPEPLANQYTCYKEFEIPVGQTVDDSQNWANEFIRHQIEIISKTDELINHLKRIDALNKSDNYCKCESTCGNNERTCNEPCFPELIETTNSDGTVSQSCACIKKGCMGNPCQYMLNLLLGSSGYSCPKGEAVKGNPQRHEEIKEKTERIEEFILTGRSDIFKELIYSRETMDSCSSKSKANTVAEQTKLVNCRRIRNNFVSKIFGDKTIISGIEVEYPCYGADLQYSFDPSLSSNSSSQSSLGSKTIIMPQTDNWFCCAPRDSE